MTSSDTACICLAAVVIVALIVAGVVVCRRFGGFRFDWRGFEFEILPRLGKHEDEKLL
jgi:hypothetical protein